MNTTTQGRSTVDIDTRRRVYMAAMARRPQDVVKVGHEAFIRNSLKDSLGWRRDQPAPEQIKAVAREMAALLQARDRKLADARAAREAAVAQGQADNV